MLKTIRKQSTTLVIPFAYSKDYNVVESLDYFNALKLPRDKVYDHIGSLIDHDEKNAIGKAFRLDNNARQKLGLPKNRNTPIDFKSKENSFQYTVSNVDLYLFTTQIGFLCIKVQLSNNEPHYDKQGFVPIGMIDYETASYDLRRFHYRNTTHQFSRRVGKDKEEIVEFDFQSFIMKSLESLAVERYFEQTDKRPTQAVMYSVTLTDEEHSEELVNQHDRLDYQNLFLETDSFKRSAQSFAYRISHSYKNSYLLPDNLQQVSRIPSLYQPFQNSIWGVAAEGVSNVIIKTGNDDTDKFFEESYFSNVEGTYFYLYMLLLNQKYGLLNLSIGSAELYTDIQSLSLDEQAKRIYAFRKEMIEFTVTSVYKHATYITHQADWYRLIHDKLEIVELQQELTSEVEALTSHLTMIVEQWERETEKHNNRKKQRVDLLIQFVTYILLPFTIVTGFFGMNLPMISTMGDHLFYWFISAMLGSLIVIHIVSYIIAKIKEKIQTKKSYK